jgi:hypothetical protein
LEWKPADVFIWLCPGQQVFVSFCSSLSKASNKATCSEELKSGETFGIRDPIDVFPDPWPLSTVHTTGQTEPHLFPFNSFSTSFFPLRHHQTTDGRSRGPCSTLRCLIKQYPSKYTCCCYQIERSSATEGRVANWQETRTFFRSFFFYHRVLVDSSTTFILCIHRRKIRYSMFKKFSRSFQKLRNTRFWAVESISIE